MELNLDMMSILRTVKNDIWGDSFLLFSKALELVAQGPFNFPCGRPYVEITVPATVYF